MRYNLTISNIQPAPPAASVEPMNLNLECDGYLTIALNNPSKGESGVYSGGSLNASDIAKGIMMLEGGAQIIRECALILLMSEAAASLPKPPKPKPMKGNPTPG